MTWAQYLQPTFYLDYGAPEVEAFAQVAVAGATGAVAQAVRLFTAVRDEVRYDPYAVGRRPEDYQASTTLARRAAFCVPKAILLAALARSCAIPARLGFADVRNHLASKRLLKLMASDVFAYHGYVELWLEGRWVKATPTFHRSLCEALGVEVLDFDGHHDAVLQAFDRAGNRHMEYLRDRGTVADFDLADLERVWREYYPHFFNEEALGKTTGELEREIRRGE